MSSNVISIHLVTICDQELHLPAINSKVRMTPHFHVWLLTANCEIVNVTITAEPENTRLNNIAGADITQGNHRRSRHHPGQTSLGADTIQDKHRWGQTSPGENIAGTNITGGKHRWDRHHPGQTSLGLTLPGANISRVNGPWTNAFISDVCKAK